MRNQQNTAATDLAGCDVVEMRRYTLRPGAFDELQEVFQRWFVDGLEGSGMRLGGQFRDRDDPDRFVWFRGFTSMAQRHEALEDFYLGPVWLEHRDAANTTMIDSDDVLLLRPTSPVHRPGPAVTAGAPRPTADPTWVIALAWSLPADSDREAAPTGRGHSDLEAMPTGRGHSDLEATLTGRGHSDLEATPTGRGHSDLEATLTGRGHEVLQRALGVPVAMWRTEPSANTFPRLPVRDGNHVVALAVFAGWEQWSQAEKRLGADAEWQRIAERLGDGELMRLEPTATSRHPRPIPA